uniref:small monomeric GTPase n=1 Tax=Megaselia scalaris TaxID=36166 RepID=T1GCR4_MEGSC
MHIRNEKKAFEKRHIFQRTNTNTKVFWTESRYISKYWIHVQRSSKGNQSQKFQNNEDVPPPTRTDVDEHELPNANELLQWADGLLLVYSITDRQSFNYIRKARTDLTTETPVFLVANKVDMVHLRQVSTDEGEILAKDLECRFTEVSAAEHVIQVAEIFYDLCKEIIASKRKSKQSLLERMLGSSRPYNRGKSDSALQKD